MHAATTHDLHVVEIPCNTVSTSKRHNGKADKMVSRKAVAQVVAAGSTVSLAKATMLVDIAAAELELPAGALGHHAAGEVERIAAAKARKAAK